MQYKDAVEILDIRKREGKSKKKNIKTESCGFRLDPEVKDMLERMAKRDGISLSSEVRKLILNEDRRLTDEYYAKHKEIVWEPDMKLY